jgi:maltose alpha-D-glucosyltransferase / alpha-amylase
MPKRQPLPLPPVGALENDPLWYKDAVIYELHVRAFYDSVDDGMGDFAGLAQKLDYLQDLGVTAIWLLPFNPSPWKDDGYDIADYTDVHSAYGTLKDLQAFLKEAHARGLRVITEVVINHTSDQHEWFQGARRAAAGSPQRDFYVWSDTPDRYKEARIIFRDFEPSNWSFDRVANAYYWHRFYAHQPDLNFDNPAVQQAVLDIIDYWFDMGVDAFRLDAIPYLYEREGTNCENLPETHEFLKKVRAHVDRKHAGRMLLAEANQWPDDSVAYFGRGDECHMAFHFPVMPRMFMAIRMEDRYPIIEILDQTPPIPDNCQWAMFLRNHDELTLEMVTDEERDYMYRVYAQDRQARINLGIRRRLAPLLGNDRRRIELMNVLLFSMPGTPVIYYGDELGMGDNIYLGDRNGVRTPMQWSADRNAGFSRANPQKLYLPLITDPEYHYETLNVEAQQNNPNSLLWWMKRLIEHRKHYKAFGRGTIEFLHPENRKVLAFYRRYEDENILIVVNLSRFPQYVELDLSAARGLTPVEIFGRTEFPPVGDQPYLLTLTAHGYYWFSLEPRRVRSESIAPAETPVVQIASFDRLLDRRTVGSLTKLLPAFLLTRRWYRGKARNLRAVDLIDTIQITESTYLAFIQVDYTDSDPDMYVLPVAVASGERVTDVMQQHADTVVAHLRASDGSRGVLYGALWNRDFQDALLDISARQRTVKGKSGQLVGSATGRFPTARLEPCVSSAEQSNSSIMYSDSLILKLFRKLEPGLNPDIEISQMLLRRRFEFVPPLAGWIEYVPNRGERMALAIVQGFVRNEGDAWKYTIDHLGPFYENVRARAEGEKSAPRVAAHPLVLMTEPIPQPAQELIGAYIESARLLGDRTARMHLALVDASADADFAPEPFTDHYRVGLYHGLIQQANRSLQLLRKSVPNLPEPAQSEARRVLELDAEIKARFRPLRDQRIEAVRTRHHGDFHLGQVLYTGKDFVIIDFEGEPQRPLGERRLKRSPLRDVAGMLRSFQYAAWSALPRAVIRPQSMPTLESWATYWSAWVGAAYLGGYFKTAGNALFIPPTHEQVRLLLNAFLLEKALYEIGYELNNRPDWVRIPLSGVLSLIV